MNFDLLSVSPDNVPQYLHGNLGPLAMECDIRVSVFGGNAVEIGNVEVGERPMRSLRCRNHEVVEPFRKALVQTGDLIHICHIERERMQPITAAQQSFRCLQLFGIPAGDPDLSARVQKCTRVLLQFSAERETGLPTKVREPTTESSGSVSPWRSAASSIAVGGREPKRHAASLIAWTSLATPWPTMPTASHPRVRACDAEEQSG